jgi:predicted dehydrogenase
MDKVRIATIGLGGMGTGHTDAITKKVEEAELVAVCDIDKAVADEKAVTYGVPAFYDHKALIKAGIADAVSIATPHYFHPPIAVDAFKAGLHVLSEKPIGVTVKAADKMLKAAEKSGKVFAAMHQQRTRGVIQAMKRIIDSGQLGRIYRATMVETHFRTQAYYNSAGWRATWDGEGGGVLLNQAPHGIDIFTWLMGLPEKVQAVTQTWRHDIDVEDEASALVWWKNGATGYYHTSTNEVPGADILEIAGDKGKISYRNGEMKLFGIEPDIDTFSNDAGIMWGSPEVNEVPVEIEDIPSGHSEIVRNWARAILYGEDLLAPGAEGLNSLEFINAVILSGGTGKPVEFPVPRNKYDKFIKDKIASSTYEKVVEEKRETDPKHVVK